MDGFLTWITVELGALAEQGLLRRRRTVRRLSGGWCEVDGRRVRDFASNDYLGLSHDPRVIAAARAAVAEFGAGAGASALVVGRTPLHERLERRLAQFAGTEAALLFPTGYAANVGTIAALVGRGDAVFSDRLNHASLIDGCRQSGATIRVYEPARLDQLDAALDSLRAARRKLIVTDGVFSMDGLCAPLPELCAIAESRGAGVLVDEAHATGVLGPRGRGVAELCGVEGRVAVRVSTLSKSIGSSGGFVAGSQPLIDWLWNRARTQVFSTAAPPAACGAAIAALDVIESEPETRARLLERAGGLRRDITAAGLETVAAGVGPIVPVIVGDPRRATRLAERLETRGFLVGAMRPPSVPRGSSRLRITVTAAHAADDLSRLVEALVECARGLATDPGEAGRP